MQTGLLGRDSGSAVSLEYEAVVETYYRPLFQFALSLTRSDADACDLTQHTFYTWGIKGQQLRDTGKVKSWLYTTLHHAFLERKRKETRFPHFALHLTDSELPCVFPNEESQLDGAKVLAALEQIDDAFRAPLALFYLDDFSYKQIADILNIPLGTVKSRIARGISQLKTLLLSSDLHTQRRAA